MFQASFGATADSFMHYSRLGTAENFMIIPPDQLKILENIDGWNTPVSQSESVAVPVPPPKVIVNTSSIPLSPCTRNLLDAVDSTNLCLLRKHSSLSSLDKINSEIPSPNPDKSPQKQNSVEECVPLLCSDLVIRHCRSLSNIPLTLELQKRDSNLHFPAMERFRSILHRTRKALLQRKDKLFKKSEQIESKRKTGRQSPSDRRILKSAIRHATLMNEKDGFTGNTQEKRKINGVNFHIPVSPSKSQKTATDDDDATSSAGTNLTYTIASKQESRNENVVNTSLYKMGDETQKTCIGIVNNVFPSSGSGQTSGSQDSSTTMSVSPTTHSPKVTNSNHNDTKLEDSRELFHSQEDQIPNSQPCPSVSLRGSKQSPLQGVSRTKGSAEIIDAEDLCNKNTFVITRTDLHTVPNSRELPRHSLEGLSFQFTTSQIQKMTEIIWEMYK